MKTRLLQRDPQPLHPDVIAALELLASELPELERQPLVDRMAGIIAAAGAGLQDRGSPGAGRRDGAGRLPRAV